MAVPPAGLSEKVGPMSTYDDMNRKVQNDQRNGTGGFNPDAARQMPSQQRENYEAAWKANQKK